MSTSWIIYPKDLYPSHCSLFYCFVVDIGTCAFNLILVSHVFWFDSSTCCELSFIVFSTFTYFIDRPLSFISLIDFHFPTFKVVCCAAKELHQCMQLTLYGKDILLMCRCRTCITQLHLHVSQFCSSKSNL